MRLHPRLCLACLSFYVKHFSNVPADLWIPRLFVLRRVVGRVRPGGDSPPCQRSFACLGQNPPTASGGPAHNGSLLLETELMLHYYWGLQTTTSVSTVTAYRCIGPS